MTTISFRILMLSICSFIASFEFALAQYPDPSLMNDKEYASYCIDHLKNGALIVRLKFKTKAIEGYQAAGNTAAVNRIKEDQREENAEIIKAFTEQLTFCPVYFISFDSTSAAQQGKKSGYFLNKNLEVDPTITLNSDFFLFAEHGMLETELPPDKTRPEQEEIRRGTMADDLIIRDKDLRLVPRPFPYYVHFGDWEERVRKLNVRLNRFYSQ